MTKNQAKKELELAILSLKEIESQPVDENDFGWMTNRRANIYSIEAEIRRLRAIL